LPQSQSDSVVQGQSSGKASEYFWLTGGSLMASPLSEPGNAILNGTIRKEQEMYFDPGVQKRRADALRELYGGHPPQFKQGPACFPVIVIPRIVPESALPLLPRINSLGPREFKDGQAMQDAGIAIKEGSFLGSFKDGTLRDGSLKEGSLREGSFKNSGSYAGSVRSFSSARSEKLQAMQLQAMQRSNSSPTILKAASKAQPPRRAKPDPMNKFRDWVEEDVKFPFKRPG